MRIPQCRLCSRLPQKPASRLRPIALGGVLPCVSPHQLWCCRVCYSCRNCSWNVMTIHLSSLNCKYIVVTLYLVVNAVSLDWGGVMEARRQKAHELADRARITFADGCYSVPSQSGHGCYTVVLDGDGALCECPDFELRGKPCK